MIPDAWARFRARRGAGTGLAVFLALAVLSLLAPLIAPQDPSDPLGFDPSAANAPPGPSWALLLGADARGRSVLALLLWGGRASLAIGVGAAMLAALLGIMLGLLSRWRSGLLDPAIGWALDVCQAAPPLLVLLLLAAGLGGVPAPLMVLIFVASGCAAPARLTRTSVSVALRQPYVEAARAAGVGKGRLIAVHLLPAALAPVAAWTAGAAAVYVALEAGLDFLGLGLPPADVSWGTALAGAQDGLAAGNWWWMAFGGAALAAATLSLHAIASGVAAALDPATPTTPVRATAIAEAEAEIVTPHPPSPPLPQGARGVLPVMAKPTATQHVGVLPSPRRGRVGWAVRSADLGDQSEAQRRGGGEGDHPLPQKIIQIAARRRGSLLLGGALLCAALVPIAVQTRGPVHRPPDAAALLRQAAAYPRHGARRWAYIANATYAATATALRGRSIPWAAWGPCPAPLSGARCASSDVQLWYSDGKARAQMEGSTFICTPRVTWGLNPMAGLAQTLREGCGALGTDIGGLGATAGVVRSLLPSLDGARSVAPRIVGVDAVAGQRCWEVRLSATGRACLDAATGLPLRVERLDRRGEPDALYVVTIIGYGLDLAPEIFANPIPGGHGPLVDGLSEPLLDIQSADDVALFSALVPAYVPAGLSAQTPTFDTFYDDRKDYALEQRVRQAYADRAGRVALVIVETLPGSPWDDTPPLSAARIVVKGGRRLAIWQGYGSAPTRVRVSVDGTAAIVSSHVLPLATLERVAIGLN